MSGIVSNYLRSQVRVISKEDQNQPSRRLDALPTQTGPAAPIITNTRDAYNYVGGPDTSKYVAQSSGKFFSTEADDTPPNPIQHESVCSADSSSYNPINSERSEVIISTSGSSCTSVNALAPESPYRACISYDFQSLLSPNSLTLYFSNDPGTFIVGVTLDTDNTGSTVSGFSLEEGDIETSVIKKQFPIPFEAGSNGTICIFKTDDAGTQGFAASANGWNGVNINGISPRLSAEDQVFTQVGVSFDTPYGVNATAQTRSIDFHPGIDTGSSPSSSSSNKTNDDLTPVYVLLGLLGLALIALIGRKIMHNNKTTTPPVAETKKEAPKYTYEKPPEFTRSDAQKAASW
jgi:hypothetical protein